MTELLEIDGSLGEGGGQILRTALALSLHLQRPIRLFRIRARRRQPGLRRQHLTCVLAAAELSRARVTGAEIGSREITFIPGPLRPGRYTFDIGTAGSTTLLLQALMPPLLLASQPSHLILKGGTHNPKAPPFDFLDQVLLPLLRRMGAKVALKLRRPGFYPRGGGILEADIEPAARLQPIDIPERGEILRIHARAIVAGLPRHVGERELAVLRRELHLTDAELTLEALEGCGIGNVATVTVRSRHITELFTGFGERGKAAERVAEELAGQVRRYLAAGVPVGPHLADQLLLPMALAGGGSFLTMSPTLHTTTNIQVIERFLPLRFDLQSEADRCWIRLLHQ